MSEQKKSPDLNRTEQVLFSLKKEAEEAKTKELFLLAEKKIMLACLAYIARFMRETMTNKRRKADIQHVKDAVLGTLAIIKSLDEHYED